MTSNRPQEMPLKEGEVHLWYGLIDYGSESAKHNDGFHQILNADERDRAARFRFARDRMLFVVSHGLLRMILSRYLNENPPDIGFNIGQFGRPELAEAGSGLRFNLSHSDQAVMIGVTQDADIGVDIARISSDDRLLEVADRGFARVESNWIADAKPDSRLHRFFAIWTLKEAYIKARGLGLNFPLSRFEVQPRRYGQAHLRVDPGLDPDPENWILRHARLFTNYRAAVAVKAQGATESLFVSREIFCDEYIQDRELIFDWDDDLLNS